MESRLIQTGEFIGDYQLLELVGDGQLGPLYRAVDPERRVPATVRIVGGPLTEGAGDSARKLREASPMLRHPDLIPYLDVTVSPELVCAVAELREGTRLETRLAGAPASGQEVTRLLDGVARGVDRLHSLGLVHGALGPATVLVAPDGHPYVTDSGLASLREGVVASPEADRRAFVELARRLLPEPGPAAAAVLTRAEAAPEPPASCLVLSDELGAALASDTAVTPKRRNLLPAILLGVAALILVGLAIYALTRPAPSAPPAMSVSTGSARPGDTVVVTANHLPANQVGTVELSSNRVQVGAFTADQYGNVTAQAEVPRGTPAGDHVLSLCWAGSCPVSSRLTVLEPVPTPVPSPSPVVPSPPAPSPPAPSPRPSPLPQPSPSGLAPSP